MKSISFKQALLIAIGSSIGSGIYFKSTAVLRASQGNVVAAVMGWLLLGLTFAFAGLAVSVLANKTEKNGGILAYVEDAYGEKAGFATGWFFAILYSPTQVGILAWVLATYFLQIFNLNSDIIGVGNFYWLIALFVVLIFTWNILSTKFAAMVSALSTSIKLIPLIIVPVFAFAGFQPSNFHNVLDGAFYVANSPEAIDLINNSGLTYNSNASFLSLFIAPLLAMAFTFDGWHTVGSFSVDMENPKRDLAKVFSLSLLIVTIVYTLYSLGLSMLMPSDQIIIAGDAHVEYAVRNLFSFMGGEQFGYVMGKLVIVIVCISVLGTTNSFAMGSSRYIQALAQEGYFFKPKTFRKINDRFKTPAAAACIQLVLTLLILLVYYGQEGHGLFDGIVIDELPVAFETVFFIPLMIATFRVYLNDHSVGILKGVIAPIIGCIGQIFILIAFFTNNTQAVLYFVICIVGIIIGLIFKKHIFDKYRLTKEFLEREQGEAISF